MNSLQAEIDAGLVDHRAGRYAAAEARYRQLLTMVPEHSVLWHLLGAACHEQGRTDEGIACIERAIALCPQDAVFHSNLGEIYRRHRRFEEALAANDRAIALNPQHAESFYKRGLIFSDQRRTDEAIACFRQATLLNPHHADAFNNWGVQLSNLDFVVESIACFQEALRLNPDFAYALNNLGAAWSMWERSHDAIPLFHRALELDPNFYEAHSNLVFALNYDPRLTPDELFAEHVRWGRQHADVLPPPEPFPNVLDPDRVIRVGFLSGDWRYHPVGHFMLPVLTSHDRSRFEFHCFDDNPRPDDMTDRLRGQVGHWHSIVGLPDPLVTERIRAAGIDLLVDLSGHTTRNRLMVMARRPAPVLASYLGYMNTTGIAAIRYRLTDAICDPPGEPRRHVEELVRLPTIFCTYTPHPAAPNVGPLPAAESGTITFGSLHNLAKLNDATLDLWARVLHRIPNSRLRIVRRSLDELMIERLARALAERGIERGRVDFFFTWPQGTNHLVHYQAIDISLDAIPWSGHTTACESLWMGVPIVTLTGDRHAGRMVTSVLTALGRPEWIARSSDEYLDLVERLASDRAALAATRVGLRAQMASSPLCDGPRFTRDLEDALRSMWQTHCREAASSL